MDKAVSNSRRKKIWKTLNEPFVIFVFLTILVGLIGWAYTELKAGWTVREQNALAIDKLNTQAAARLEFAELLLGKAATQDDYARAIDTLLADTNMIRLYPDFKDRSTLSIIWEIEQRTKSKRLSDLFPLLQNLNDLKTKLSTPLDSKQQHETFEQIRETVRKIDAL